MKMFAVWPERNGTGIEPRYGYSGRDMFGAKCFGLEGRPADSQIALLDFAAENPQTPDIIRKLVKSRRQDHMGLNMIIYFHGVDIPEPRA